MSKKEFLLWLIERLVEVYGENPNADFLIRLKKIADENRDLLEEWQIVQQTPEKHFLISNYGRLFNTKTSKFIKSHVHNSRSGKYLRVNLGNKKFMVHVLVAKAFIPNSQIEDTQVDHIDRNTLNCNANNLRWVSQSTNISHFHNSKKVKFGSTVYYGVFE